MSKIFEDLFSVIESRKGKDPCESYVASLMNKGTSKINEKILEEARETCEASIENDKAHLVHEICDLIFHTFVLAEHRGISLADIETELNRRFGTSGHAEKESRSRK
jgi:phosphoribosyl-ATP pyrophosphohydrolase